jgi:hypothetical protein
MINPPSMSFRISTSANAIGCETFPGSVSYLLSDRSILAWLGIEKSQRAGGGFHAQAGMGVDVVLGDPSWSVRRLLMFS